MSVASRLWSVKIDQADSLTMHVDSVTVDHVNVCRNHRVAGGQLNSMPLAQRVFSKGIIRTFCG
jgi:hypothetical protein